MDLDKQLIVLKAFEEQINAFCNGELGEEQFIPLRTLHGVYSLRGQTDRYLIRLKLPAGVIRPGQLLAIAEIIENFRLSPFAHITTRQGIEIYGIRLGQLSEVLLHLARAGLSSFASGGNSVRGVVCCPLAGISRDEVVDVTGFALAVSRRFLETGSYRRLPRKIKIGFEGCGDDHVHIGIQDIGISAFRDKDGKRFFKIYAGGGLGTHPTVAQLLEDQTDFSLLLPTVESIIRVYDRLGNRKDRNRARLKFLIQDLGMEKFRELVFMERQKVTGLFLGPRGFEEQSEILESGEMAPHRIRESLKDEKFARWFAHSVYRQRQGGYTSVLVRCHAGNLNPKELRRLEAISDRFGLGHMRTTPKQNIILRWVPENHLLALYKELKDADLAACCADQIMDITRCAGADTCLSAVTSCHGLASALEEMFRNGFGQIKDLTSVRINVSGCPNSCGQHLIAGIGFQGAAKKSGDHLIPCYRMFLGGRPDRSETRFGKLVAVYPARRIPRCLRELLEFFLKEHEQNESFEAFVFRIGIEKIRRELEELEKFNESDIESENLFKDFNGESRFRLLTKRGECSI